MELFERVTKYPADVFAIPTLGPDLKLPGKSTFSCLITLLDGSRLVRTSIVDSPQNVVVIAFNYTVCIL